MGLFGNIFNKITTTPIMATGGQEIAYIHFHLNRDYAPRFQNDTSIFFATGAVYLWKAISTDSLSSAQIMRAYFAAKSGICELGGYSLRHEQSISSTEDEFLSYAIQLIAYKYTFMGGTGLSNDRQIVEAVLQNKQKIHDGINYARSDLKYGKYKYHNSMRESAEAIRQLMESPRYSDVRSELGIEDIQRSKMVGGVSPHILTK